MSSSTANPEWDLPQLVATVQLKAEDATATVFGVQFYPFNPPGLDPIFAVTGGRDTLVCRPLNETKRKIEIIRRFRDADTNASLNSLTWTKDPESGHPLLCVTGALPKIKILDVITGELVRTLIGHGGPINDIALSPKSFELIATASEDTSIRFWSLNPKHRSQPCALICAGEGHKETILTIAFHSSGQYLLSGGADSTVNMWVIPDLPNETTGTDDPTMVHYPHFATSGIHSDYIDCIMFYNDLIVSRCARENKIVLWRIDGLDPSNKPPPAGGAPIPNYGESTRSAFGDGYQRLLQFRIPQVDPFYLRFGLFQQPFKHAVLAMGNLAGRIYFWDLQQLVAWSDKEPLPFVVYKPRREPLTYEEKLAAKGEIAISSGSPSKPGKPKPPKSHDMSDPYVELHVHYHRTLPRQPFLSRQIAWSPGGEWMVVVGEQETIAIFNRWGGHPDYVRNGNQS